MLFVGRYALSYFVLGEKTPQTEAYSLLNPNQRVQYQGFALYYQSKLNVLDFGRLCGRVQSPDGAVPSTSKFSKMVFLPLTINSELCFVVFLPQEAILRYNVAYSKKWDFTALTDFCEKVKQVDLKQEEK